MVDTLGRLSVMVVHTANIQDRNGAKRMFAKTKNRFLRLRLLWADGGCAGKSIEYVYDGWGLVLVIVKRSDDQRDFKRWSRRWGLERTLGWLMNDRRLNRNHEFWLETSEATVKIAMIHLMLHRFA